MVCDYYIRIFAKKTFCLYQFALTHTHTIVYGSKIIVKLENLFWKNIFKRKSRTAVPFQTTATTFVMQSRVCEEHPLGKYRLTIPC